MKKNNINFDDLTFTFTETQSMYVAKCRKDNDWETGELVPYGNISISPAATVLKNQEIRPRANSNKKLIW